MFNLFSGHSLKYMLQIASMFIAALSLAACVTTQSQTGDAEAAASGESQNATEASASGSETKAAGEVAIATQDAAPAEQPVETIPVRIDVSCKNEPYSKYEQASRDSIAKGLSATQAETYGVGFRDLNEHKLWSETHGKLFTAVNNACTALNKCATDNPKDKAEKCAQQAAQFSQWQELAKSFADKAKESETTQPPKICSFTPNLDDAGQCFHDLADNVDKACDSEACKETSACWRSVGFLDIAINQAESACRFAHQDLAECRGYQTTVQRRKAKFTQCVDLQKSLNVTVLPVL